MALFALVMGGAGLALGYFSATYLKAALALLENNPEKAMDFAEKGMAKIPDLPFEGQRNFELKWLQAVLMKVRQVKFQGGAQGNL